VLRAQKLPVLYRAQILTYLIAVDECVTVFESAMGGEPGLNEDASQRRRVSIPDHRDIHFQGGYCRYEPMVPAVSWLMRQAPTAGVISSSFHTSATPVAQQWRQGFRSIQRYIRTSRLLGTELSRFNPRADGLQG
jgi:hypothetical protein